MLSTVAGVLGEYQIPDVTADHFPRVLGIQIDLVGFCSYGSRGITITHWPVSKTHGSSWSFLTRDAAETLITYRRTGALSAPDLAAIDEIWGNDQESRKWARSVLVEAGMLNAGGDG